MQHPNDGTTKSPGIVFPGAGANPIELPLGSTVYFAPRDPLVSGPQPYTFEEYSREAPEADMSLVEEAMPTVVHPSWTPTAVLGHWLRLINTICKMEGMTLEGLAKSSLLGTPTVAEVVGGTPRVS